MQQQMQPRHVRTSSNLTLFCSHLLGVPELAGITPKGVQVNLWRLSEYYLQEKKPPKPGMCIMPHNSYNNQA